MRAIHTAGCLACAAALLAGTPASHAQQAPLPGVVVAVGGVDGDTALAAARAAGGARWRLERIGPTPAEPDAPPNGAVARLREAYLAADFLRCLATLSDPALDLDALLEAGHRPAAAAVGVFGAACAWGAEDRDLARRLLGRAFAAELDVAELLAVTTPDFQQAAETVRSEIVARARVETTVTTRPQGADVVVDGGGAGCKPTPCTVLLLPGTHRLVVSRLGHAPRAVGAEVARDGRLSLALDPAPADEVRRQLARALAGDLTPGDVELARVASAAFEARVVVVVWETGDRAHAHVYDRTRDRVLARTAATGDRAVSVTVRSAVEEWRGLTEPTPLLEEPLFWAGTIGAALAVGVTVFLLTRPAERSYALVFRRR